MSGSRMRSQPSHTPSSPRSRSRRQGGPPAPSRAPHKARRHAAARAREAAPVSLSRARPQATLAALAPPQGARGPEAKNFASAARRAARAARRAARAGCGARGRAGRGPRRSVLGGGGWEDALSGRAGRGAAAPGRAGCRQALGVGRRGARRARGVRGRPGGPRGHCDGCGARAPETNCSACICVEWRTKTAWLVCLRDVAVTGPVRSRTVPPGWGRRADGGRLTRARRQARTRSRATGRCSSCGRCARTTGSLRAPRRAWRRSARSSR
jgi:hypothetical protein